MLFSRENPGATDERRGVKQKRNHTHALYPVANIPHTYPVRACVCACVCVCVCVCVNASFIHTGERERERAETT